MIWIACLLLVLTLFRRREGFNPFLPDTRPVDYPEQSNGDLLLAEKYIQKLIDSNTSPDKLPYLTDLLNLLQFI